MMSPQRIIDIAQALGVHVGRRQRAATIELVQSVEWDVALFKGARLFSTFAERGPFGDANGLVAVAITTAWRQYEGLGSVLEAAGKAGPEVGEQLVLFDADADAGL
jgi:hypothetical protein